MAADDQMRMPLAQFVRAEALLLELAVAEILDEDVGARQQSVHGVAVFRLGEVEHDTALAAVE